MKTNYDNGLLGAHSELKIELDKEKQTYPNEKELRPVSTLTLVICIGLVSVLLGTLAWSAGGMFFGFSPYYIPNLR